MTKNKVAVFRSEKFSYPVTPPFNPSKRYPELSLLEIGDEGWVYDAVRESLHLLGLDSEHFGTPAWNPLGDVVRPGDRIVVKPNLVQDYNESGDTTDCMITHASVLRPIVDYIWIALRGKGRIIIADAPHGNTDFDAVKRVTGLDHLERFYKAQSIHLEVRDVRKYEYGHGPGGFVAHRTTVDRDPEGYVEVNLGSDSALSDLPRLDLLYGADFDRKEIRSYHNKNTNKYLVAKTFLSADVLINVPKLKTHKKIGTTLNVKSLIGINGDKNYLPHYRIGDPRHGGDEFPNCSSGAEWWIRRIRRWLFDTFLGNHKHKHLLGYRLFNRLFSPIESAFFRHRQHWGYGDWCGNETVYRTVYDLSKILFLADKRGVMQQNPQRRFFSFIDGVVAGEKNGPLAPSAKPAGVIIAGADPIMVDMVATRLMGFDVEKMVVFSRLRELPSTHPLQPHMPSDIVIESNMPGWKTMFLHRDPLLNLTPHYGWVGFLEI